MAEAEAPALPADILADIRAEATESFGYWNTNANEAQKAVGAEDLVKYTSDPEFL